MAVRGMNCIPNNSFNMDTSKSHDQEFSVQAACMPMATGLSGANVRSDSELGRLVWRGMEIVTASVGLVLTLPVMLLIAAIIKLGTPGPALFFQTRLGRGGRTFRFVKFRTLYADARQRFPELYRYQYNRQQLEELKFKVENDPRVTPQGQWLRKSTLDELPNLWNVLTGEMSLVGPRPEIPEMLCYYEGEMREKFDVRPGVTGLAQVSGRGRLGFYETVELDLKYVRTRSIRGDFVILLKTIRGVLLRDGAF